MKYKVLAWFIMKMVKLLASTWRYHYIPGQPNYTDKLPQYIAALWHRNIAGCIARFYIKKHVILISRSKDGDIASNFGKFMGQVPVRGSSSRGGGEAKLEMKKLLSSGLNGCLTVDGPRGPVFEVKYGIIEVASELQIPIMPVCVVGEDNWTFKSWDRFRLPKPFSKVWVQFAEPFIVPAGLTPDDYPKWANELKNRLMSIDETFKSKA